MVILLNPPNPPSKVSNKDMMGGFGQCYPANCDVKVPPLDIPYIAAVLRENKIEVEVIDCLGSNISEEQLIDFFKEYNNELICIRTSTPTFIWDIEIAKKIKKIINGSIIFFGPHINIKPMDIIKVPSIDAIVLGEPEYVIKNIVLNGMKNTLNVWYKEQGKIIKNKSTGFIQSIDDLPYPAWDLLPYNNYTIGQLMPKQSPTLFLQTSRGCPFACSYCPYPISQGTKYRERSYNSVLNEITYLIENYDVKNILIRDPEFTLNRDRVVKICQGLIYANYSLKWRCETRVDTLDEALIELMGKAGCIGINIGIESNNRNICKNIGRVFIEEEHTKSIIKKCKELGIHTFCFFIIGLPGDNIQNALNTIKYAVDLKSDISQFTVATPYLKTKLYKWAFERDYIEALSEDSITGYEAVMRNDDLTSSEIQLLRNQAQALLNRVQLNRKFNQDDNLKDADGLVSIIMDIYFSWKFSRKVKDIIIYGTKGISIAKLKKRGFKIIAVTDESHEGKLLMNNIVFSPMLIKLIKPKAIIVSPFKNASPLKKQIQNDVVFIDFLANIKNFFIALKEKLKIFKRI